MSSCLRHFFRVRDLSGYFCEDEDGVEFDIGFAAYFGEYSETSESEWSVPEDSVRPLPSWSEDCWGGMVLSGKSLLVQGRQ